MLHSNIWTFLIVISAFLGLIISIYFQQNLAKILLKKGYKWANRPVTGNLLSNPEGRLWIWYLLSGSWRDITDISLKHRCARWAIFQILALLLFIFWGLFIILCHILYLCG